MYKFNVTFKKESGNRGSKQFVPAGFELEVVSNNSVSPHETEVKKAVEQKLATTFTYSCSPSLWEAKRI